MPLNEEQLALKKVSREMNTDTPFKQSYRQLGIGGVAQKQKVRDLGKTRQSQIDIAQKQQAGMRNALEYDLTQQREQLGRNIEITQEDIEIAKTQAREDVENYVRQIERQRAIFAEDLRRERERLKKALKNNVTDQQLQLQTQSYTNLIGGLAQTGFYMAPKLMSGSGQQPVNIQSSPAVASHPITTKTSLFSQSIGYQPSIEEIFGLDI